MLSVDEYSGTKGNERRGATLGLRMLHKCTCVTLCMCSTCTPVSSKYPETNEKRTQSAPWGHGRKWKTNPWWEVTLEGHSESSPCNTVSQRQPSGDTAVSSLMFSRRNSYHTLKWREKWKSHLFSCFFTCLLGFFWFLKYCILGSIAATVP